MRILSLLVLGLLLAATSSFGQGVIRGKIVDENGLSVIGATVVLKSDATYGTITDFDGKYELKITSAEPQTLVISFISFKTIEEVVNPIGGEVLVKNFTLLPNVQAIKGVTIEAKVEKSRDYYMEKVKMNSATSIDYISSQQIKRTGDSYVVGAVRRVAGVSTNSGGFITVRGIGDRYIKTTLKQFYHSLHWIHSPTTSNLTYFQRILSITLSSQKQHLLTCPVIGQVHTYPY